MFLREGGSPREEFLPLAARPAMAVFDGSSPARRERDITVFPICFGKTELWHWVWESFLLAKIEKIINSRGKNGVSCRTFGRLRLNLSSFLLHELNLSFFLLHEFNFFDKSIFICTITLSQ